MFIYQSQTLNATENLLNMAGGKIWNDLPNIYRFHHKWRHLHMPIRNLILLHRNTH